MEHKFLLYNAVSYLAEQTHAFSDTDMGQPFAWRKHAEGVRLAYLGTYHELRDLATLISQARVEAGLAETAVLRTLAQNHLGYRDLQAVLVGVSDEIYDQESAPGEWPLRTVLSHIVAVERTFFALAHVGLEAFRQGNPPPEFPEDANEQLFGSNDAFWHIADEGTFAQLWAEYEQIHVRSWDAYAGLSNEELNAPTPLWWEEEIYPIEYRLRRMDVHLRQHLIQVEKTLDVIGQPETEVKRLLRQVFAALAEVEGLLLDAPQLAIEAQQDLANNVRERTNLVVEVVQSVHELETAVKTGDNETVEFILAANPELTKAHDSNGLSLVLTALYYQKAAIAQTFVEHGAPLSIHSAAALGDLETVQKRVERWAGYLDEVATDGFTPLQLACFFNQEDVALWLIAQGANVTAVSQNGMSIQPMHAACSANNINIVRALLEHGADVNAKQANDFTPLHTAADNNSTELVTLLLEHGADKTAVTSDGQTAYDWAVSKEKDAVLPLLQ